MRQVIELFTRAKPYFSFGILNRNKLLKSCMNYSHVYSSKTEAKSNVKPYFYHGEQIKKI